MMDRPTLEEQITVSKMSEEDFIKALLPQGVLGKIDFWLHNGWKLTKEMMGPSVCYRYNPETGGSFDDINLENLPIVTLAEKDEISGRTMTDSSFERDSYSGLPDKCRGRVLMVGLGVGLLPSLIWDKLGREVTQFDVLEYNPDVISLVGSYIKHPVINIILGNAWEFYKTCQEKYDFIFLDLWNPAVQAIAEGPYISKFYSKLLKPEGEVRFWLQETYSKLDSHRGKPIEKIYDNPCLICGGGDTEGRYSLYGGLCLDCAWQYEGYLYTMDFDCCIITQLEVLDWDYQVGVWSEVEDVSNRRLADKIRDFFPGVDKRSDSPIDSDTRALVKINENLTSDILVKCENIAIEAKKQLELEDRRDLESKAVEYLRDTSLKLYVVIYGNYKVKHLTKLVEFISNLGTDKVKLICQTGRAEDIQYVFVTTDNVRAICEGYLYYLELGKSNEDNRS